MFCRLLFIFLSLAAAAAALCAGVLLLAPRRAAPFVRPCQSVSHSIEDALHSDYYWIGFQWAYTYCLLLAHR